MALAAATAASRSRNHGRFGRASQKLEHIGRYRRLNNEAFPDRVKNNLSGVVQVELLHQIRTVRFNG